MTINGAATADPLLGSLPSTANACLGGNLQYQFCRDGDPLGDGPHPADRDCDDIWDLILRGWTENSVITVVPQATAGYTMEVRCSALTSCKSSELVNISVTCPNAANALGLKALRWPDKNTIPNGYFCNSVTWRSGSAAEILWTGTAGDDRDATIGN